MCALRNGVAHLCVSDENHEGGEKGGRRAAQKGGQSEWKEEERGSARGMRGGGHRVILA